jgi:hypothetical protein
LCFGCRSSLQTAASASFDKSAPLEIPTLLKRAAEETLGSVAKKPRFEETQMQVDDIDLHVTLDSDVDATKAIISRERQWRSRTTILQSAGKVTDSI